MKKRVSIITIFLILLLAPTHQLLWPETAL
jgi:hypothetical protein